MSPSHHPESLAKLSTDELASMLSAKQTELEKLRETKKEAEAAAAAAPAAAASAATPLIDPANVPPMRTVIPAAFLLFVIAKESGMGEMAKALSCLLMMTTMYFGQKMVNKFEKSEWREKLRADAAAAQAPAQAGAEAKARAKDPSVNPKKKKKQ
tara:strand:- start:155 stop:619 length:465 start_codon:yes stop_codon:yes gene_type:complete